MKLFSKRTVIFLAVLCLLVCLAVPAAAAALGCEHRYDAVVTPPTCTEKGYTTYTCANCGDSYVDDYVDEAIHSYEAEVLRATCTEDGYTVYTCTVCGDQYLDDDSEATGHNYEPVVQPPSCEEHYATYVCTNCGDVIVDDMDLLPPEHDYVPEVFRPTCTEDGYTVYTCSVCGDRYLDNDSEATGHNYEPVVQPPLLRGALCHLCLHQLRRRGR